MEIALVFEAIEEFIETTTMREHRPWTQQKKTAAPNKLNMDWNVAPDEFCNFIRIVLSENQIQYQQQIKRTDDR